LKTTNYPFIKISGPGSKLEGEPKKYIAFFNQMNELIYGASLAARYELGWICDVPVIIVPLRDVPPSSNSKKRRGSRKQKFAVQYNNKGNL
jgi:hypothetical protein